MCWKSNLARALKECKFSAIEIHARTGISTTTISNMQNNLHESFLCSQFILLKLLLEKKHIDFLSTIFGKDYFQDVKAIADDNNLNAMGDYFKETYHYEVFSKKKVVDATKLVSSRLDYILTKNYESIKIDEITKLEIASGTEIGFYCDMFFSHVKLNSDEEYEKLLKKQRDINKEANSRRKPKEDKK
ncbi:hypothetical protein [Sphingobacterium faecale]|uniref:XRE family transcriptional regulator n=1 Tax=Sphingobacterium faecale TaxID=2803775 RepID=A0ABS1R6P8_9SPHI|nr:hypothetical protein [Sphingobacterium faecale]MBL1410382.1 hypothetical protein [Sphingobacterium faecale]